MECNLVMDIRPVDIMVAKWFRELVTTTTNSGVLLCLLLVLVILFAEVEETVDMMRFGRRIKCMSYGE